MGRSMKQRRLGLTILACACTVAVVGAVVGQALAGQKKSKEQASSVVPAISPKLSPEPAQKPTRATAKKTAAFTVLEQQPKVLLRKAKPTPAESKKTGRKGRRHVKVSKKIPPKVEVQSRTDLMYYGLLERPQRYDPSRDRQAGRAPNPQAGEILHDHFQELDKNHDGMIDPFERAFGRLDMDRDVSNHQWK